jgi:YfiH family protein
MSWQRIVYQQREIYQCGEFNGPGLIQAVSTVGYGNMALHTGGDPEEIIGNRQLFLADLGLSLDQLVAAVQVHGTRVAMVDSSMVGSGARTISTAIPATDALITAEAGPVLAIFTADCLPIFLYDPATPAVGIVHAGWRGTLAGVAVRAVETMARRFRTRPEELWVTSGPAICGRCFKVSPEVAVEFAAIQPESVSGNEPQFQVDLAEFNFFLLERAGVQRRRMIRSELCTVCHRDRFFSYRAQTGTGNRLMGIISLKNR